MVEGHARAEQSDRSGPVARLDHNHTLPILIHGDAAFAAQGVVAETLQHGAPGGLHHRRHAAPHRQQPGRLHHRRRVRAAPPTYASDLAKGFDVPIIHVNADDPEACLAAARLAMAYRQKIRRATW